MKGRWKALDPYLVSGWGISEPQEIPGRKRVDGLWGPEVSHNKSPFLHLILIFLFQNQVRETPARVLLDDNGRIG